MKENLNFPSHRSASPVLFDPESINESIRRDVEIEGIWFPAAREGLKASRFMKRDVEGAGEEKLSMIGAWVEIQNLRDQIAGNREKMNKAEIEKSISRQVKLGKVWRDGVLESWSWTKVIAGTKLLNGLKLTAERQELEVRKEIIEEAMGLGATRERAEKLAETLVNMTKILQERCGVSDEKVSIDSAIEGAQHSLRNFDPSRSLPNTDLKMIHDASIRFIDLQRKGVKDVYVDPDAFKQIVVFEDIKAGKLSVEERIKVWKARRASQKEAKESSLTFLNFHGL
ncbi:MAG: hypothetical protein Q8P26_01375 [Candidatus Levybacteria bacterium]|nr:hypothetical protein [Candidatus Levybacteria bacterium]